MSRKPRRELVAMVDNVVLQVVVVAVGVEVANVEAAHEVAGAQMVANQWWRRGAVDEDGDASRTMRG